MLLLLLFFCKVFSTRYLQPLPGACCSCMLRLCLHLESFLFFFLLPFFITLHKKLGPPRGCILKLLAISSIVIVRKLFFTLYMLHLGKVSKLSLFFGSLLLSDKLLSIAIAARRCLTQNYRHLYACFCSQALCCSLKV